MALLMIFLIGLTCNLVATVYVRLIIMPKGWSRNIKLTYISNCICKPAVTVDYMNNKHIMLVDDDGEDIRLYYMKIDDEERVVVEKTRIVSFSKCPESLSIVTDIEGQVHVSWMGYINENSEIYYLKLDNNGSILVGERKVSFNPRTSRDPSLAVDLKGNVHIVWSDSRDGNYEVYYTKLNSRGDILISEKRLTAADLKYSLGASIAVDTQDNLHIIWIDNRNEGKHLKGIYYKKLDSEGNEIIHDTRIASISKETGMAATGTSEKPLVASVHMVDSRGNLHLIFFDEAYNPISDRYEPLYFYEKLDNQGNMLIDRLMLTDCFPDLPSISQDWKDNVYIVFSDIKIGWANLLLQHDPGFTLLYGSKWRPPISYKDPFRQIFYMKLNDQGGIETKEEWLTADAHRSICPKVILDKEGNPYVFWLSSSGEGYQLLYKRRTSFSTTPWRIISTSWRIAIDYWNRILAYGLMSILNIVLFAISHCFAMGLTIALSIISMFSIRKFNPLDISEKQFSLLLSDFAILTTLKILIYGYIFPSTFISLPGGVCQFITAIVTSFTIPILIKAFENSVLKSYFSIAFLWTFLDLYYMTCFVTPIMFEPVY